MEFFVRVLSSNGRRTERQKDAKEAEEAFRENQDNIGRLVGEEHGEWISPLLEMVYDSSFPEEQVFMKNPSLERLKANKHVVTRILSGLSAQGIPAIDLLCRVVEKHGIDPVADCIITLLTLLSRLLANRDDPTFTTDDVVNAIDLEWHCSSRTGSPLLSVLSSTANSPARFNLSPRKLDSPARCGLSPTIRSSDGRNTYANSQSMKLYTLLQNATFPKRVSSTVLSTAILNHFGSRSQETSDLAIKKPAIDTVRLQKTSTRADFPQQQSRHCNSVENLHSKSQKQQSEEPDSLATRSSEKLLSDGTFRDQSTPSGTSAVPSSSEEKIADNLPTLCFSHESEHNCSNPVMYEVEVPDSLKVPIMESICHENADGLKSGGLLEPSQRMNLSSKPSVLTDSESRKIDCETSLKVPVKESSAIEVQKQESDEHYSLATSSTREMSSDDAVRNQMAGSKTLAKKSSPNDKDLSNLPTACVSYESDCNCSNSSTFDGEIPDSLKVPILEHIRSEKAEGLCPSVGLLEQSQGMNLSSKPSVPADAASMKIDYQTKLTVPDISCTRNDELSVWPKLDNEVTSDHNDSTFPFQDDRFIVVSKISKEPHFEDDKCGMIFDSSNPADLSAAVLYGCSTASQRKESNHFQNDQNDTPVVSGVSEDLCFQHVQLPSALVCSSQHVRREDTNGTLNLNLEKPELTSEPQVLLPNVHPCFSFKVGSPSRNISIAPYSDGRDNSSDSEESVISDYSSDSSAKFSSWSLSTSASFRSTFTEDRHEHLKHQKNGRSLFTMDPLITATTHVTDTENLSLDLNDSHFPNLVSSSFPPYKLLTSGDPSVVSSNLNLTEISGSDIYESSRNFLTDLRSLATKRPENYGLGTSLPLQIWVSGTHLEAANSTVKKIMDIPPNLQLEVATSTSPNSPTSDCLESSEQSSYLNVSPSSSPCSKSTVSSHASSPPSEESGRSISGRVEACDATLIMVKQTMNERLSQLAIMGVDRIESDQSKGWNNGHIMEGSPLNADSMVPENTGGNHAQNFQISRSIQLLEVFCNSVDGEAKILISQDKEESAENLTQASQIANKQRICEVGLSILALSTPCEFGQKEGSELEFYPNSEEDGQGGCCPCLQACAKIENVDVRPKVPLTKRTEESNCSTSALSGDTDSSRIELVPLFQLTPFHEVKDYAIPLQPSQDTITSDVELQQHVPTEESIPTFQPREICIQRCTEGINFSNNDASNMLNLSIFTLGTSSYAATVTHSDNSTETHNLTAVPAEIHGLETLSSDVNKMKELQSDSANLHPCEDAMESQIHGNKLCGSVLDLSFACNGTQRGLDGRLCKRMRVGSQSSESFSRGVDENEGNTSLMAGSLVYDSTPEVVRSTSVESSKEHHRPVQDEELCDKAFVSHFSCGVSSGTDPCFERNKDSNCATERCDPVCYTNGENTPYVTTLKSHSNSLFRLETGVSRSSSRPRKRRSSLVEFPRRIISSCLCLKQPSTMP